MAHLVSDCPAIVDKKKPHKLDMEHFFLYKFMLNFELYTIFGQFIAFQIKPIFHMNFLFLR